MSGARYNNTDTNIIVTASHDKSERWNSHAMKVTVEYMGIFLGYKGHTCMMLTYNDVYMDICEKCKRGGQCVILKHN